MFPHFIKYYKNSSLTNTKFNKTKSRERIKDVILTMFQESFPLYSHYTWETNRQNRIFVEIKRNPF